MVGPYEMQGRKIEKGKAEKYDDEVEEADPETAVEEEEAEAEEEEEEGGNRAESRKMKNREVKEMKSVQVGTDLPSFPLVAQGQNRVNRPGGGISIFSTFRRFGLLNHNPGGISIFSTFRRFGLLNHNPDLISKLPDDILVDILSTLELREAAKTSVLSRRWLNLWTLVPRLRFDATEDLREYRPSEELGEYRSVLVNWVNHVLGLHKSSNLRQLGIFGCLDKHNQNEIDKWLEYALGKGVQKLELHFSEHFVKDLENDDAYVFPNQLLEQIAPPFGFSCVRALHFSVVNISGEAIESLLRKCPLLEELRVIGSVVLAIMKLYKFPELKNLRRLVLAVPYCIGKSLIGLTSLIDSCPRLEEFALVFHAMYVDISDIEQKKATKQSLKGLKVFELHAYCAHDPYDEYQSEMIMANESEMIMFFIENAVALEKIVIDPRFVTTRHGAEPIETEQAKRSRRHAIETFPGVVPKHVHLVIL